LLAGAFEVPARGLQVRVEPAGGLELGGGLDVELAAGQGDAVMVPGVGIARIEPDGLGELPASLIEPAQALQRLDRKSVV